jgi:hypothetical protein
LIVDTQKRYGREQIKGKPVRFGYEGIGWDPKGGPITITWGGKVVQKHPAAASFKGEVQEEWPHRGRSECRGVVAATQGRVTRAEELAGRRIGVVVFADNDRSFKVGDFFCDGEDYLFTGTEGTVIVADTRNELFVYRGDGKRVGPLQGSPICLPLFPGSRGYVVITTLSGGQLQIARRKDCP